MITGNSQSEMQSLLHYTEKHDTMICIIQVSREEAERLSRLYLAIAQEYRRLAGLKPIQTPAQQHKMNAAANR